MFSKTARSQLKSWLKKTDQPNYSPQYIKERTELLESLLKYPSYKNPFKGGGSTSKIDAYNAMLGYQEGGFADRFNIPSIFGKIKRKNPEWTGEAGKVAGEKGISIRRSPSWISGKRSFTIGNTIFIPEKRRKNIIEQLKKYYGISTPKDIAEWTIRDELPHVAQYREEGLLGFGLKHVKDLLKYGAGEKTYDVPVSHEGFHSVNPGEKERLMNLLGYQSPQLASRQEGGPAERPPMLAYMQPAVQDETAHDNINELMFENELEQQPQYSMRAYQEGYDPAQAWGEGMMPIGGTLAMLKRSYGPQAKEAAHYRDILDKKLMNILKKYEGQTRGRSIEKSLGTRAGQEATQEAMETDFIIQKLKGKI
jgi:hypothetical protein